MSRRDRILQIIPTAAQIQNGVGDYARTLDVRLREQFGIESVFVSDPKEVVEQPVNAIVLHYVNYGYQARGIPFWLLRWLRSLRGRTKIITIFHELYASGRWRQSAFWLQPLQKRIVREIAALSQLSIVSSEAMAAQLRKLAPNETIAIQPVFSNFREPILSPEQLAARDPGRWAIAGGTQLLQRSLRSFMTDLNSLAPREVLVIGGVDSAEIRNLVARQRGWQYFPGIHSDDASSLLGSCAFGWIDYFEHSATPTAVILKSSIFAAYCAHGVIPVLPEEGAIIAVGEDVMPGPFSRMTLPDDCNRGQIASAIYEWYQRNSSSNHLAQTIAGACKR